MADIPYPLKVSQQDRPTLLQTRVKEAYFVYMTDQGQIVHSDLRFVSEDGRVSTFAVVPEKEIKPKRFTLPMVLAAVAHRPGLVPADWVYDQGRALAIGYEVPEIKASDEARKRVLEEGTAPYLDAANLESAVRGKGMEGLKFHPHVHIEKLEDDPRRAQHLFDTALDVTKMLQNSGFAYALMPRGNGRIGINSHTFPGLVMQRAAEIAGKRSMDALAKKSFLNPEAENNFEEAMFWATMPDYAQRVAAHGMMAGSPLSSFLKGPDLDTLRKLGLPWDDHEPNAGRWAAGIRTPLTDDMAVIYKPN